MLTDLFFVSPLNDFQGNAHRSNKSHTPAPIYEEMSGVQPLNRKLVPLHLEEMEPSEYRNCPVTKPCLENHYESPRSESQKWNVLTKLN